MPELGLDQVHRLTLEGELGGMRVTKSVGMGAFLDPGAARETWHEEKRPS